MLLLPDGKHTGSISGGCLEGDVSRKASWLTEDHRPALRVYDTTSEDDAVWEFGLGCNGVVKVLLERIDTAEAREALQFFQACRNARRPGAVATCIDPDQLGHRIYLYPDGTATEELPGLHAVVAERKSRTVTAHGREYFIEAVLAPLPLFVFGAGHDAIPLTALAHELGWHVTVADGRPAYATAARFPSADEVRLLPADARLDQFEISPESAVVLMSHNYPQDSRLLERIWPLRPRYLGILGPRARTERMLSEVGVPGSGIHFPIGLDVGAETPAAIALSIVAEIQAVLSNRPGGKLTMRQGPIHEVSDNPRPYRRPLPLRGKEFAAPAGLAQESRLCSLELA